MLFFKWKRPDMDMLFEQARAEAALIVDVRTDAEYREGHIPGSVNVPLDALDGLRGRSGTEGPIYVYCLSGARSARATAQLRRMGYQVVDMGGISNYHGRIERGGEVK